MTITPNPSSAHLKKSTGPKIDTTAFVHLQAFVCGDVTLGKGVFVAPFASVRADEGSPFFIGDFSNIQDGAVLHALETFEDDGSLIEENLAGVDGKTYSIYIGKNVSLAHQTQIHGPCVVEDETFIGMQAFIFRSRIGKGCVIEPGAKIVGVKIPGNRYVPAGTILKDQSEADNLPKITNDYPFAKLNEDVVRVNTELARAYKNNVIANEAK